MLLTDSSPINLFRWIDKIYHLQVCYMLALSLFFVWVMTGVRLTLVKCHLTLRQVLDCIRRLVVDPSQGKSSSICDSFNIQRIISPQHRKYFRSRFSSYHDFFYLSHFLFELWILTKDFFLTLHPFASHFHTPRISDTRRKWKKSNSRRVNMINVHKLFIIFLPLFFLSALLSELAEQFINSRPGSIWIKIMFVLCDAKETRLRLMTTNEGRITKVATMWIESVDEKIVIFKRKILTI